MIVPVCMLTVSATNVSNIANPNNNFIIVSSISFLNSTITPFSRLIKKYEGTLIVIHLSTPLYKPFIFFKKKE